jgi:anti-sigma factor RsiW
VSCTQIEALGVYVLGAVDESERAAVDAHVTRCPDCRRELDRLLPLPGLLAALAPDEAVALEGVARPPAGLLTRLRAAVTTERRRRVRQRVAVAVASVVVLLASGATGLNQAGDGPPAPTRVEAVDPQSGVRAAMVVAPRAWGTEVSVRMYGAAPGEHCRLVVRGDDGGSEVAATWRATYQGRAEVTGSAAIPRADVVAVDVMTTAGRRLVHMPIPAS